MLSQKFECQSLLEVEEKIHSVLERANPDGDFVAMFCVTKGKEGIELRVITAPPGLLQKESS